MALPDALTASTLYGTLSAAVIREPAPVLAIYGITALRQPPLCVRARDGGAPFPSAWIAAMGHPIRNAVNRRAVARFTAFPLAVMNP